MTKPQDTIDKLQLSMQAEYVKPTGELPANRNEWKLNWRCVISRGSVSVSFDYFQGIGHLDKFYSNRNKHDTIECIKQSMLTGKLYRKTLTIGLIYQKQKDVPQPAIADVLYCVTLDSSALFETFSDWCNEYGYSNDSIAAKTTYDACCDNARKLLSIVGTDGLTRLQTAFQDY